jgi:signal peptidase II
VNKNKQNIQISILSAVALLLLDIATKMWTTSPLYKPVVFIRNFFYFTLPQHNSGVAFGIQLPMWAQVTASTIVLVVLALIAKQYIFSINKPQFIKSVLFGIIIGGAAGNLINRVMQGYVVDFIVLRPIPTFNIADIGITVGLIGIFLTTFTDKK